MYDSYVSLSKFQEPCCRPMPIQITWLLLWTSLSKCPDVPLQVNTYPSAILVAEDANAQAHSTFSHQHVYMFVGINIYPHCILSLCLWNSMLLWANAHASSIFVAMGQHPSNDHICRYGPPYPNFQIYAYGLIYIYIYPSTIPVPENAMPMQDVYFLLWADSHPKSMCSWGWKCIPIASEFYGRPSNFCVVWVAVH